MSDFGVDIALALWGTLREMSPYLLFGFLISGILYVMVPSTLVERHLGGRGVLPVLKASLFGVPLPLCSCGVIPVAASLRKHGASRGATVAFLISTPQTGVDSIAVTYSLLGPVIAIFRPVAAFVSGLIGGFSVDFLEGHSEVRSFEETCSTDYCVVSGNKVFRALYYGFVTLAGDIAKPLLAGILISGLISVSVPDQFFAGYGGGILGMLLIMVFGIPLYVCATASVPIAAALILKGISPGVALVFLMTGPATNAATIATIWKIMGKKTALLYLASVAGTALASGLLLDFLLQNLHLEHRFSAHEMLPDSVMTASAILLLLLLSCSIWKSHSKKCDKPESLPEPQTEKMELHIEGMRCSHCSSSVERALKECKGTREAKVDLKTGNAVVWGIELNREMLVQSVRSLGYEVK